jgi:HEAT repeat protein
MIELLRFSKKVEKLSSENYKEKDKAFKIICGMSNPKIIDPLLNVLEKEKYSYFGYMIVEVMGRFRDKRAVVPLVNLLYDEKVSGSNRNTICCVLAKIGDKRAIEPLLHVLFDPFMAVRRSAAQALKDLGEKQWLELLGDFTYDDNNDGRSRVANCGDPRIVEPLCRALNSFQHLSGVEEVNHRYFRYNVVDTIKNIGGNLVVEALKEAMNIDDPKLNGKLIEALKALN